jgi:ABC-2 type transport system permease protein
MIESFLFSSALRDNLRAKRLIPWIALAFLTAGIAYAWHRLAPDSNPSERYGNVSSIIVFRMLALAAAIFTTGIVSQEVEQRTIVYLLTRPVPRWKLLIMRYLAAVVVVAIVTLLAALATSLGVFGAAGISNELLVNDVKALVLGAMAYCGLFLLVSLIFNRAMIICLLYAFGWETSVPNMPGDISRLSIFSYLQAIAEHPVAEAQGVQGALTGNISSNMITGSTAYPTLVLLIAITLGVSLFWFTKFEYVPREDAE